MSNPLADLIARGEGSYNSYNRGTEKDEDGKTKVISANQAIDFSELSVSEVERRQALPSGDPDRVFAFGRYQMIPGTFKEVVDKLGIAGDTKLRPETQDRMFSDYLMKGKRPQIEAYVTGQGSLHAAQKAAAMEWASIDDPDTPGKPYGNYAAKGNRSTIRAEEVAKALDSMKAQYQADLKRGMSPEAAWRDITTHGEKLDFGHHASRDPLADGVFKQGEHGQAVRSMQEKLSGLGYTGTDGKPLVADGDFGQNTRQAVERFQRDQGLTVDGKAGPKTLEALAAAVQAREPATTADTPAAPSMADPGHPDHARYRDTLEKLQTLEQQRAQGGLSALFADRQQMENAAGQVVFESRVSGMNQVDSVVARLDGQGLFAVQGQLGDPASLRVYVDHAQAVGQDVQASTRQLEALAQVQDPALAQAQAQAQAQTQAQQPAR
jgi:muramidase (phage lysozyme)